MKADKYRMENQAATLRTGQDEAARGGKSDGRWGQRASGPPPPGQNLQSPSGLGSDYSQTPKEDAAEGNLSSLYSLWKSNIRCQP